MSRPDKPCPKFALVSHVLPPSSSGQAIVLYRLLRDLDPANYCLISIKDYTSSTKAKAGESRGDDITNRLAGNYHVLPEENRLRFLPALRTLWADAKSAMLPWRAGPQLSFAEAPPTATASLPVNNHSSSLLQSWKKRSLGAAANLECRMNLKRQVAQRAQKIYQILRRERGAAVVACSGDLIDLPAAAHAAQRAGLPFFAYMFDDYAAQGNQGFAKRYTQAMARKLARQAAGVIAPNEFLARVYRDRYGINPWIIPNPVELPSRLPYSFRPMGRPVRIVYTGAIYEAHYDAFCNLLQALRTLREPRAELHIYTSTAKRHLEQHQIGHPAAVHGPVSNAEALRLQQTADILFLPLAFESPYPEIVNTSAPGKMGEMLASGRPILAHAPKGAFVSWYCKTHECALVVDERDPQALRNAIQRLAEDVPYCQRLVERGFEKAQEDFAIEKAQERFLRMLSFVPEGRGAKGALQLSS